MIDTAPLTRRYRFNEWLSSYSESERKKKVREMRAATGVSRATMRNWLDLRTDASFDVPYSAVLRICQVLGRDVKDVATA